MAVICIEKQKLLAFSYYLQSALPGDFCVATLSGSTAEARGRKAIGNKAKTGRIKPNRLDRHPHYCCPSYGANGCVILHLIAIKRRTHLVDCLAYVFAVAQQTAAK